MKKNSMLNYYYKMQHKNYH